MSTSLSRLGITVMLALGSVGASATEIPLYETGPAEDSAFIRFVNGDDAPLEVHAAGSKTALALTAEKPVSEFLPVRANRALKGEIVQGGVRLPNDTTVAPGEFASVIAVQDGASGLALRTLRETPDDFNALKAVVGFYNLAPGCTDATLKVAGRDVALFSKIPVDTIPERRQINPVALTVQLFCADQATGAPLSLGTLQAGERYTVFLVPSRKEGSRIFQATDVLAF